MRKGKRIWIDEDAYKKLDELNKEIGANIRELASEAIRNYTNSFKEKIFCFEFGCPESGDRNI